VYYTVKTAQYIPIWACIYSFSVYINELAAIMIAFKEVIYLMRKLIITK